MTITSESNRGRKNKGNMKTTIEITAVIKSLKKVHTNKQSWLGWYAKLESVSTALGMSAEDDISEMVSAENFVAAGFSQDEADAFVFVLTQEVMFRQVNSISTIERFFCYEVK